MRTKTGTWTGSMRRRALMVMPMVLAAAVIALAADIDGKWKGAFDTPDGQISNTFTFKVDGEKVTGTVLSSRSNSEAPLDDGVLKGDDLSFTVTRNVEGSQIKFRYKGKVKGDEIALTLSGEIGGQSFDLEMIAKREKP